MSGTEWDSSISQEYGVISFSPVIKGFCAEQSGANQYEKRYIPALRRKLTPHSELTVEKVYLERTYFVLFDLF
jgi:hypothetical protein